MENTNADIIAEEMDEIAEAPAETEVITGKKRKKNNRQGNVRSISTKVGDWIFVVFCVLISAACLLPLLHLLAKSLSDADSLVRHEVWLLPKNLNFDAYTYVLGDPKYIRSFIWTAFLTVICTLFSLFMTVLCAYPMIFKELKGRRIFNIFITITMFFNAGTIPNYLLMQNLGLLDNPLVLILPSCLSVFNMIIMRSFFYGIPDSLRESAEIDGATHFQILWKIYIPLSAPVMATLALFYAVGRWNGYSDALMYVKKTEYYPLQLLLYNVINNTNNVDIATQEGFTTPGLNATIKAAIVMFSTIPILCVYPWLQKYFIHGMTVGAVKE